MVKVIRWKWMCAALFINMVFSSFLMAKSDLPPNIGNQGYSLVSYFEHNTAEMGSAKYSVKFKGETYWFTSQDQVDIFNADPHSYLPLFGEMCPYSLALGRKIAIDPTNFKIIGGQLLLFHRSEELDGLKAWDQLDDDSDLLDRAQTKFELLRFD